MTTTFTGRELWHIGHRRAVDSPRRAAYDECVATKVFVALVLAVEVAWLGAIVWGIVALARLL